MRTAALTALVLCTSALAPASLHAEPGHHRRGRRHRPLAAARAPDPDAPPDVFARRLRALDLFARSGHIRRCWMQQLQRDATSPPRTLSVRLEVDDRGMTRRVQVADGDAPLLARCLAAGAWSLQGVGPGEAFSAEGTLRLDRGE